MVRDGSFGGNWPIIGGHEPAGEVVAVGDNVEGVSIGERVVALLPRDPCGRSKRHAIMTEILLMNDEHNR